MKLTVLGGCGAWPTADQACSGYLVEHDGFCLLIDPGYATLPQLLRVTRAESIDAVLVSHGHPDHCADLSPLLRARVLSAEPPPPLPVHTLPSALDPVLSLDGAGRQEPAIELHEFSAGDRLTIGPFGVGTWPLPHFVPNAGLRLTADGHTLAYTGDSGPSDDLVTLAGDAGLFLAEATFAERMPSRFAGNLSTAVHAGQVATRAGAGRLMLTHLWPGSDPATALAAARAEYRGETAVASPGITVDLGSPPGYAPVEHAGAGSQ